MISLALLLVVCAALASSAKAFWRLPCDYPVLVERIDPIVSPGAISAHLHTISGASSISASSDYASLQQSSCTSCAVTKDLSAYWTPTLFYRSNPASTGQSTFTTVPQTGGVLVYYLQRQANSSEQLHAFPQGFKMLAGNPYARSFAGTLASKAVTFTCLDYSNPTPQTNAIPNRNCPQGLRAQLNFPSCYDPSTGNVAYPSGVDNGVCPAGYPTRLISLFYEVTFQIDQFKNQWWAANGSHPFVLSNGDPTGYGFHGDFLNGWDTDVLQNAINTCTADSGVLEDCNVFTSGNLIKHTTGCAAPVTNKEVVIGQLNSLPGCNPVTFGPNDAPKLAACPDNSTQNPDQSTIVPSGFSLIFANETGAVSGTGFAGVITYPTYNPANCAQECLARGSATCSSFDFFIETAVSNGVSTTQFKCTLWNVVKGDSDVTNRPTAPNSIVRSNGYVLSSLAPKSTSISSTSTITSVTQVSSTSTATLSSSATTTATNPVSLFTKIFSNETGSINGASYMTYVTLPTYNVTDCATRCLAEKNSACITFGIFYETQVTSGKSSTVIKCTLWSAYKDQSTVTNRPQAPAGIYQSDGISAIGTFHPANELHHWW